MDEGKEGTMAKQKNIWKKKHGTGWEKLTCKLKQEPCCVVRKNKQSEQTMWNTRKTEQPNHHFVECVTRKGKQCLILWANAKSWNKISTREGTAMLQEKLIENCVGNTTWKELKNGMNILQKLLLKMRKWRFCGMLWYKRQRYRGKRTRYCCSEYNERSCAIIDIAIPGDVRVSEKEMEKIERYQELKREIKKMWNIRSIKVISVVVGALASTEILRRTGSYYRHSRKQHCYG